MTNRPTPQTADVQKETQKKESQKITLRRLGIEPATILFTTLFLVHCLAQAKNNFNTNEIREAS